MPESVQLVTRELIASVLDRARQSPRLRTNHNFHASMEDNPHRFLNVMLRGTYVQPHRHIDPPKSETFLVLEGRAVVIIFDSGGRILERHIIGGGAGAIGVDLAPGVWHTPAVLSPHAVFFEVKPGPYSAATDKSFAPWAPREGDPEAPGYLSGLLEGLDQ